MRRSRHVTTLLLGSALAALTGCSDPEQEARVFSDVATCIASGLGQEDCDAAFQAARAEHPLLAPRYPTEETCEAEVGEGACERVEPRSDGGFVAPYFIPLMTGFLIAEVLDEAGDALKRKRYGRPLYADRSGYLYNGQTRLVRVGNCNPSSQSCGGGGGGFVTGAGGGSSRGFVASTRIAENDLRTPRPATTVSSSRKSAGFGATGLSAGGRSSS